MIARVACVLIAAAWLLRVRLIEVRSLGLRLA